MITAPSCTLINTVLIGFASFTDCGCWALQPQGGLRVLLPAHAAEVQRHKLPPLQAEAAPGMPRSSCMAHTSFGALFGLLSILL